MPTIYLLIAGAISIATLGQTLLKYATIKTPLEVGPKIILQILTTPLLFFTFVLYFFGSILWLFILKKLPLSVAYPTLSLTYVTVALVASLIFQEPFTTNKMLGMGFILAGVFILFR